jgi:NAD dependent epimerase/dehydratase family enzyme
MNDTAILAELLHRPARLHAPESVLRLLLGEMASETMLASLRVTPARLQEAGLRFAHDDLRQALRAVLRL